jgi:hypothetical protein
MVTTQKFILPATAYYNEQILANTGKVEVKVNVSLYTP